MRRQPPFKSPSSGHEPFVLCPAPRPLEKPLAAMRAAARAAARATALAAEERQALWDILHNKSIHSVLQPVVSLRDSSVLGYEALGRGPVGSPLGNPEALINAALRHGRMLELEHLFRYSALRAARQLAPGIRLFLNVNPNIIQDPHFGVGFTKEYLTRFAISAEDIVFEITERESVDNLRGFKKIIEHYKAQNYKISIDDAGAGYSGLNLISDVQPHFIKLDMCLIRGVDKDLTRQALIKSMQDFAALTNTRIIAEGIETEEELATLISFDVPYGQGYFIQRPAPAPQPIDARVTRIIHRENKIKNRFFGARVHKFHVRHITRPGVAVPPSLPVLEATAYLERDENLQGLCVVHEGRPVGVVMRHQLHRQLSGRFGFSLFAGKSVASVMDEDFLAVDHQTTIDIVSRQAMRRDNNKIYDFVTVTRNGCHTGIVTVRELLEKSIELEVANARQLNPLSELPGNALIDIELERLARLGQDRRVLYFDIDNFKAYNDKYGFKNGDRVLKRLASIIAENMPQGDFVGHIGGDDFIAVTSLSRAQDICLSILNAFEQGVAAFYTTEDLHNGWMESKNRQQQKERFPLMSLTIVGVRSCRFKSGFALARAAASLKKRCKQLPGSNSMFDDAEEAKEATDNHPPPKE
ncbi:GGDEF domain-containing protein [Desulfovibrio sp.]|uniref:GGDEF domain-containing protein n=1 Tax=Desulfovibrio sp. TaxID=885 RepID=UPI0025BDAD8A|nr:GGDEF domain-containing protein [Desulfovibrio sp.]